MPMVALASQNVPKAAVADENVHTDGFASAKTGFVPASSPKHAATKNVRLFHPIQFLHIPFSLLFCLLSTDRNTTLLCCLALMIVLLSPALLFVPVPYT